MPFVPEHFACWFEIPVTDLDASKTFYSKVFDMELSIDTSGPNPMVMFPTTNEKGGISGHLYPGKPSENGPTIHLVVPDNLEAAKARVFDAGGKIVSDNIAVPAGHFCYAKDLDGNSIGLFEAAAA